MPEDYEDPDNYNYYCVGKFEFDEPILNKKIDSAELYITVGAIGIPSVIFDLDNKFEKGNPYDSIYLWVTVENETASVCISSSGTNALPMDSSNFFEEDRISSPNLEMHLGVRATLVLYTLDDESSGNSKLISLDRAKDFLDKAKTIFFMQTDHLSNDEITELVNSTMDPKYNYDGVYGPIPDPETGIVDLSNYASKYIPDYGTITEIPQENLDYLNSGLVASNMHGMFEACEKLQSTPKLNIDISQCTDIGSIFDSSSNMVSCDLSGFSNTSKVANMSIMFGGCNSLTTIIGLGNFDTSNATNMNSMFDFCRAIEIIDLSNFDTSNVTNTRSMFLDCKNLTSIKGIIDMRSCTSYDRMFDGCNNLSGIKIKNPPQLYYDDKATFESQIGLSSDQYEIVS